LDDRLHWTLIVSIGALWDDDNYTIKITTKDGVATVYTGTCRGNVIETLPARLPTAVVAEWLDVVQ
jgi:hypothetical protein